MSESTTSHVHIARGQWPALGPKVGLIEKTLTMSDYTSTASGNSLQVFVFDAPVILLCAGLNVTTACDTSVTLSLGDAEDGTQYVNAHASAATGQASPVTAAFPVIKAAASQLSLTVGGAACTTGVVQVWALILDPGDITG